MKDCNNFFPLVYISMTILTILTIAMLKGFYIRVANYDEIAFLVICVIRDFTFYENGEIRGSSRFICIN
jgi:hypothetical protein